MLEMDKGVGMITIVDCIPLQVVRLPDTYHVKLAIKYFLINEVKRAIFQLQVYKH